MTSESTGKMVKSDLVTTKNNLINKLLYQRVGFSVSEVSAIYDG